MFVEVMYADLTYPDRQEWVFTRRRVTPDEVYTLRSDRVLFVILSSPCAERPRLNGHRRVAEVHGYDNYVLARMHQDGENYLMLDGWDDHRFSTWHRESAPFRKGCAGGSMKRPAPAFGVYHRVFTGVTVPDDVWARALELFQSEVH